MSHLLSVPTDLLDEAWEQVRHKQAYRTFAIENSRVVHLPTDLLFEIQRRFLRQVLYAGPISPAACAGVPGRTLLPIISNHLRAAGELLCMDIQDAYGSTSFSHVSLALRQRLRQEMWVLGLAHPQTVAVAAALTYLVVAPKGRGPTQQLPLGTPTSVALFNLVCLELDGDVLRLLDHMAPGQLYYTRYVDDLAISGSGPLPSGIEQELEKIIWKHRYRVRHEKTRRCLAAQGVICGMQRTKSGEIEPSDRTRQRLAEQIRTHLAAFDKWNASVTSRDRTLAALRGLDSFIRRFYDNHSRERPPELRFVVPDAPKVPLTDNIDVLWR